MSYIGILLFYMQQRNGAVIRHLHSGSELQLSLGYWTPRESVTFQELFILNYGAHQLHETYLTP